MLPPPHNVARQRVGCSRFHPASTAFATTVSGLSLPALTVCFPCASTRGVKVRVEGNWTGLFGAREGSRSLERAGGVRIRRRTSSRRARDWVVCNESDLFGGASDAPRPIKKTDLFGGRWGPDDRPVWVGRGHGERADNETDLWGEGGGKTDFWGNEGDDWTGLFGDAKTPPPRWPTP
jgi:hypothetical protein